MPLIFKDDALLFIDGALALHEDCCCEDDNPSIPITCSSRGFVVPTYFDVTFPAVTNTGGCLTCTGKGGSRRLKIGTASTGTFLCHSGSCCGWTWSLCEDGVSYDCDFGNPAIWQLSISVPTDGVSDMRVNATLASGCGGVILWSDDLPQQTDFTAFSVSLPYNSGTECNGVVGTTADVS